MTEPVTPATPAPTEPPAGGVLGHIEQWVAEHLAPELAALRADVATALEYTAAHAQNVNTAANLLLKLVQTADPAAAPAAAALVGEVEQLVTETGRIAGELAAKM